MMIFLKWSNLGKGVAPSPTPWCSRYQKGRLGSPSTMITNLLINLNKIEKISKFFLGWLTWNGLLLGTTPHHDGVSKCL